MARETGGRPLFPLYVICDADVCARAGWTLGAFIESCLEGGARFLQIRAKAMPGGTLLDTTAAAVAAAVTVGATVIVNDRADIARLADAAGVHVGQDDLSPRQVRKVTGSAAIVGLSTHTAAQLQAALDEPIDYAAIGPVFGTATKETGYQPVGLSAVRAAALAAGDLPVVAIGGITLDRAARVLEAGAASVAVIADLLAGGDPARRVRQFLAALT
jgi:thiamine-phosphate pyrophosphorylase